MDITTGDTAVPFIRSTPPDKTVHQTFPQLTFTRFFAAFLVIIFHYGITPRQVIPFNWFNQTTFFTQAGGVAVHYFFVLSGFVMMTAYRNRDVSTGAFARSRLLRIYPAYFAAIVLAILIRIIPGDALVTVFDHPNWLTAKHLFRNIWHSFQGLPSFLIGMLTCELGRQYQHQHQEIQSWLPLAMALLGLTVVCILLFVTPVNGMLLAPLFGLIAWGIAYDTTAFSRFLSLPALVILGELSYGIYIFQSPVCSAIDLWTGLFDVSHSETVNFYLFVVILFTVAWLSFRYFELPVQRWGHKRWR